MLPPGDWHQAEPDDLRETPSRTLLTDVFAAEVTATACDPVAMEAARWVFGDEPCLTYASHPPTALEPLGEWPVSDMNFMSCRRCCAPLLP